MLIEIAGIEYFIPNSRLKFLGRKYIRLIKKRIASGKDVRGQSFKPYSTNWFARPLGGLTKGRISKLEKLQEGGTVQFFQTKQGKLWALIKGYKMYKEKLYPEHADDWGRLTGETLGGMITTEIDERNNSFTVGFSREELAERFYYFNQERESLGVTDDEHSILSKLAAEFIQKK